MDLLGDARSPESSNHTPDSSFEPYISAVSIFCGAVYKEQPHLNKCSPANSQGFQEFAQVFSYPQGKWNCSCAKLLKAKVYRGICHS